MIILKRIQFIDFSTIFTGETTYDLVNYELYVHLLCFLLTHQTQSYMKKIVFDRGTFVVCHFIFFNPFRIVFDNPKEDTFC